MVVAAYSPRFAAPHAQRSELKASVNNALLGSNVRELTVTSNVLSVATNEYDGGTTLELTKVSEQELRAIAQLDAAVEDVALTPTRNTVTVDCPWHLCPAPNRLVGYDEQSDR
jgi:hypothetical protein